MPITQEVRDKRSRAWLLTGMRTESKTDRPPTLDELLERNFLARSIFDKMSKDARVSLLRDS